MSGISESLGVSNSTKGLGSFGQGVLGYLFDPANISGQFGSNAGPGAFMNPNGKGGALYPGGPGLPGGNTTGNILNTVAESVVGGEFLGGAGAGGLGNSLGMTGASDSSIADMLGSVNPGAGTEAGITDAGASAGGAGKGSGLMGGSSGGSGGLSSLTNLAGPVLSFLKPQAQTPKQGPINPPKGGETPPPTLVASQQMVNRSGTKAKGSEGGQSADLQKLLQLLRMAK